LRKIRKLLKNGENVYIAETPDFVEKMFLLKNNVLIANTCDYKYTLFIFENDDDAEDFFNIIDEIAGCIAKLGKFETCPFLWSFQQEFLRTLASYFNAKVLRGTLSLSLRDFI
jgi:hypothetical protein